MRFELQNCMYNAHDMNNVCRHIEHNITNVCNRALCRSEHTITVDDVSSAIHRLKANKADGVEAASSDTFINGCSELHIHLARLFNIMIIHGISPHNMLISTLIPIPKNKKKSMNDSDNYRAIALGSVVGKMIDNIILEKNRHVLLSNDLQYGFKAGHSTAQCTFVLNEVVNHYVQKSSPLFLVLLDASKAFDRVEYVKLFNLLLKRGLCSVIARFLAYLYTNQSLRVSWNGQCSALFTTSNGVKQGGILSPILFCVYIDELLSRLKQTKVGCYVGSLFYGALGYADDICLLAPNRNSMSQLIKVCELYGQEYSVKFNSTKSHLIVYDRDNIYKDMIPLRLNGDIIHLQQSASHLGHSVGHQCDDAGIKQGINDMVWRTNYVMSKYGFCDSNVRSFMFRTYCTSYYGCVMWKLDSSAIEQFYTSWRKCIRKIWNVPHRTHCRILPHLYGNSGIETQLLSRFMSFYINVMSSENPYTHMCGILCQTSRTAAASNRRLLLAKLKSSGDILNQSIGKLNQLLATNNRCNDICTANGLAVRELCMLRDGSMATDLTATEIEEILQDICIN